MPKLASLNALSFLPTWEKVLWAKLEDRSTVCSLSCNVEVVPDEHKGLALRDLPRLSQSFFAETLECADTDARGARRSACKEIHSH